MYSKKLILTSVLSLALAASPLAMAQQSWPDQGRGPDRGDSDNDRHDNNGRGPAPQHDQRDHDGSHDGARRDDGHGPPSWNGDRDNRNDSDHRQGWNDRDYRHAPRHDDRDDRGWQGEREHYWHGDRYRASPYREPRGYERHEWHHGDRLPRAYRGHRYVIDDYRDYRLYAPPRGHAWVRVDNDVVLTVLATGVVAAVVYGIFE